MTAAAGSRISEQRWVDAAPFRAHLTHLMATGDLSPGAVAVLVGISPRLAHRLVHGRQGRALRRIDPLTARKLLRVTTADARRARRLAVPAQTTVHHLRQLQRAGWSTAELARLLGLRSTQLEALLSGSSPSCSQLVSLRAAAEAARLLTPLPLRPDLARTAA